ncbi:MAG: 4-(cytidine 5'-diphospho)-2-C-methyl-D-erythritol kinase [Deltaproteobacteria bacterium]|nr:4-(cytidine 5'-diphospho)-2-C-methyl-D-erythritol kinase [Deltaproteobacteria bacterium]
MKIHAPAKINISLRILGKRHDGYHEVQTIMIPVTLFDEIFIQQKSKGVFLEAPGCNCSSEENLVYKAARLFLDKSGKKGGVSITLVKHIPIGAGLGGGSSDAACVLLAMNTMFGEPFNKSELMSLASKIGADCPFFLFPRPMLMGSRGDEVLCDVNVEERAFLLVLPAFGISTACVYSLFRAPLTQGVDLLKIDGDGNKKIAPESLLVNDLESVAFQLHPELDSIKRELLDIGALGALMSGSGSTVFGIFRDREHMNNAMDKMSTQDGYSYIPTTVMMEGDQWK